MKSTQCESSSSTQSKPVSDSYPSMPPAETPWFLYVLQCNDGSLYCGITTDLLRRLDQHNAGTGARYTRAKRPVLMATSWPCENRSAALKSEAAFKKLSRAAKIRRISDPSLPSGRGSGKTKNRRKKASKGRTVAKKPAPRPADTGKPSR